MHVSMILQRLLLCVDAVSFLPGDSTLETILASMHTRMVPTSRATVLYFMKEASSLITFDMSGNDESFRN